MKTSATAFLFLMLYCLYGFGARNSDSGVLIVGSSGDKEEVLFTTPVSKDDAVLYDASELPISKSAEPSHADLLASVPELYRVHVETFSAEELDVFLKKKASYLDQLTSAMKK
jgi:hypothetical protein